MSRSIYDYPVEERPRIAVARVHRIHGDYVFDKLLDYLNLTYDEFIDEYGEKLAGDPTCLKKVIVDMMMGTFRQGRLERKKGVRV